MPMISIVMSFVCVLYFGHVLACFWYRHGRQTRDNGEPSWLSPTIGTDAVPEDMYTQYLTAIYWTFGHLTAAPVDGTIAIQNNQERLIVFAMIILSLAVLGTVITSIQEGL